MSSTRTLLGAVVLVLAVVSVNAPTLDYGFVYDDQAVIVDRPPVWEQGWRQFFANRQWGTGRHVVALSFDLDRGDPLRPTPFHVTNVVIASVLTILVFALALSLGLSSGAAFAGSLLFAVHPGHVDAIVSIVGRAELMAAASVVAILLLHVHGYPPRGLGLVAAALLFATGLGSKESTAVAPLLMALYDGLLGPRKPFKARLAPYAAIAAGGAIWLAVVAHNLGALDPIAFVDNPIGGLPAYERVPRALSILWRYLGLLLAPVSLVPDRSYATIDPGRAAGLAASAAFVVALVGLWRLRKRAARAVFCCAWFPASFAVTGNVLTPIAVAMAERLLLLPSVGIALLVGTAIDALSRRGRATRWVAWAMIVAASVLLAFAYDARGRVWTNDMHYHTVAVFDSPNSAKAHYNLGLARARAEDYAGAEAAFRRAIEIYPAFSMATYYLANVLVEDARLEDAVSAYEAYLAVSPGDTGAMSQLATLQLSLDRYDDALATAQAIVEIAPDDPDKLNLLGLMQMMHDANELVLERELEHVQPEAAH